jgi:hypothetical protein
MISKRWLACGFLLVVSVVAFVALVVPTLVVHDDASVASVTPKPSAPPREKREPAPSLPFTLDKIGPANPALTMVDMCGGNFGILTCVKLTSDLRPIVKKVGRRYEITFADSTL